MNLANPARSMLQKVPGLNGALDKILARLNALWAVEHHPDGTHGAVTADSLAVEEATVAGDLAVEGDLTVSETSTLTGAVSCGSTLAVAGLTTLSAKLQAQQGTASDLAVEFGGTVGTGFYHDSTLSALNATHNNVTYFRMVEPEVAATSTGAKFEVGPSVGLGTGTVTGNRVDIRNNSSGNGAAGTLILRNKSGSSYYLWVDATGDLRIHTSAPTEDGGVSDTAGTVVGTQS